MKYNNPFVIYKDSSPYLYLTENSGIVSNVNDGNGGMVVALNPSQKPQYNLVSIQLWVRSLGATFPTELFEIQYGNQTIVIDVLQKPDGRAELVFNKATTKWYQNGALTISPMLQPQEWTALTVSFVPYIALGNTTGRLILKEGYVFNNISEYVYENDPATLHTNKFDIVPTSSNNAYEDYTYAGQIGTALIVVDDMSKVEVFSNGVDIFTDVEWQVFEKNVV